MKNVRKDEDEEKGMEGDKDFKKGRMEKERTRRSEGWMEKRTKKE